MYSHIVNPINGRKYKSDSKNGISILNKYKQHYQSQQGGSIFKSKSKKLENEENGEEEENGDNKPFLKKTWEEGVKNINSFSHKLGDTFTEKKNKMGEEIKNRQHRKKREQVVINISKYNDAFENNFPVLLEQYIKAIEKYDDKDYQDAVIRDGCKTAWYIITNLKNLNLKKEYSCQTHRERNKKNF
jgi:tyrosine-protein phosphatase YwqE